MRIGDALRQARHSAGLTQAAAADRGGLAQSTIARWERGEIAPTVEHLIRYLRAIGGSPSAVVEAVE